MMKSIFVCVVLATVLVAMGASATVIPYVHCWESDLASMGGYIVYVGANNDGAVEEIPSGNSNYMSGAFVPPVYFPGGFNAFMRSYSFANGGTLSWVLGNGVTMYHVDISTNSVNMQCNVNAPMFVTFHFNAPAGTLQTLNTAAIADRLELAMFNVNRFPYANMLAWTWTNTADGFSATVELAARNSAPTQYQTAATYIGLVGDRAINSFTNDINNAIGLPLVNISYLSSNGTGFNTAGAIQVPAAPVSVNPTPLAPTSFDPNAIVPYADCWERNGTTLWFYFGYNNTAGVVAHVPAGGNNRALRVPDGLGYNVIETFTPGFSSFAMAVPMTGVQITQTGAVEWTLLTHVVRNVVRGSSGECRKQEGTTVWINFSGTFPTTQNLPFQLEALVQRHVPGAAASQISIITNGAAPAWRIEVTFSNGPVSPARCATYLYLAFYNSPSFASELEALVQATPQSLHGQPTSTELAGSMRAAPMAPYFPPVTQPVHKKLSGGAIFGIIVGVVAGIALMAVVIWYLRKSSAQPQGGFEKLIQ